MSEPTDADLDQSEQDREAALVASLIGRTIRAAAITRKGGEHLQLTLDDGRSIIVGSSEWLSIEVGDA